MCALCVRDTAALECGEKSENARDAQTHKKNLFSFQRQNTTFCGWCTSRARARIHIHTAYKPFLSKRSTLIAWRPLMRILPPYGQPELPHTPIHALPAPCMTLSAHTA